MTQLLSSEQEIPSTLMANRLELKSDNAKGLEFSQGRLVRAGPTDGDSRFAKPVQRQMKCAEEDRDWCLNREWTRIHTNSGSDSV